MSQPAARIGDMTSHGGVVVMGTPTVLIGGMPAAKITDMHVCPLITVLVPHVGGPILPPGSPTVLIGGMPAARVGDMATCVGPPDTIVLGCMTVLIGSSGSGSGGGGGGAAQTASYAAHAALVGTPGPQVEGPHWIEYKFVDSAGKPLSGIDFEFTHVSGNIETGTLAKDGKIYRGNLPDAGECTVKIFSVHNAQWSVEEAQVGDEVELTADVIGFDDGFPATIEIWEKDITGPDDFITKIETQVDGGKVKAKWVYEYHEDDEVDEGDSIKGYSSPEYYFEVTVNAKKVRSNLLKYADWIELHLKDEDGNGIAREEYILYLPDGFIREGQLDGKGNARVENIPPGKCKAYFKNISGIMREQ